MGVVIRAVEPDENSVIYSGFMSGYDYHEGDWDDDDEGGKDDEGDEDWDSYN